MLVLTLLLSDEGTSGVVGGAESVENVEPLQVREAGVHSAGRSDKDSEAPKGEQQLL